MRTFQQFIESLHDPKRDPKIKPWERTALSSPEDDDYIPGDEDLEDDEPGRTNSPLGLTAQYPLAKASGNMRGLQTKSPKELFQKDTAFTDRLSGPEMLDTLRSKLYAGERMSMKEINYLLKLLNKEERN